MRFQTATPREAPFGIFTGGSFVLDSCRVFCWFHTAAELADYLTEGTVEIYQLDEETAPAYLTKVQPVVTQIRAQGLTEELRTAFNLLVKDIFVIDWWGNFDELVKNETEFAQGISRGFLDEEEARPIQDEKLDGFIDYLKTCAV